MSQQPNDSTQVDLKQLWGGRVPVLTPEQADLAIKVWHKIKARREREQQVESDR